jgi:hypothetical protein
MGSIVTYTKKQASVSEGKQKGGVEYTAKGNRLYRFTPVSKEELERLRVPTYRYLL